MALEIGQSVRSVDPDSYDDSLLELVAGNPLHMLKFSKRAAVDIPDLIKRLEDISKSKKKDEECRSWVLGLGQSSTYRSEANFIKNKYISGLIFTCYSQV